MAAPQPSYTKVTHSATHAAINPTLPALSSAGRVVVITGATGGIGRATALSFAASGPKALVLLGRREDALSETAGLVRASHSSLTVATHTVDLLDSGKLRRVFADVVAAHGTVEVVVHAAGVLAPVVPLIDTDPATFLDGYKTTVVGTLTLVQALVLGNGEKKDTTLVNLTTAGIFFPPFPGMGAYASSKLAAVKLLQAFGAENPHVRIHHVHPGFLDTAMSRQLAKTTKLPFSYDDSEFLFVFIIRHRYPSNTYLYFVPTQYLFPPTFLSGSRRPKPSSSTARSSSPPGMLTSSRAVRKRLSAARP